MPLKLQEAIKIFKGLSYYPTPSNGRILSTNPLIITSQFTQLDVLNTKKISHKRNYVQMKDNTFFVDSTTLPTTQKCTVYSKSGNLSASLISEDIPKETDSTEQSFEIWNKEEKTRKIFSLKTFKHGTVHCISSEIGSIQFSPNEKQLLYIAEEKTEKVKNWFVDDENETEDDNKKTGKSYAYKESFGEQMTKCSRSILCLLDIETGASKILNILPENLSLGLACWNQSGDSILCVAWNTNPYRLGLKFCPIRLNSVYLINVCNETIDKLIDDEKWCNLSPRFSNDKFILLQIPTRQEHCRCGRLVTYDFDSKNLRVIMDVVDSIDKTGFPGISLIGEILPRRCFSNDAEYIFLRSIWQNDLACISINLLTGKHKRIMPPKGNTSITVLDVYDDYLLAECSALNSLPVLIICKINQDNNNWIFLDKPNNLEFQFEDRIFEAKYSQSKHFAPKQYSAMFAKPKNFDAKSTPLIVFNHGGPHSACLSSFNLSLAVLVSSGYALLMVNYRGSLGQGDNSIKSLPGLCGKQDVEDIIQAVDEIVESEKFDKNKLVVIGGSHGGFLTVHMIGQYPEKFKAAVCRNPVVNLASMVSVSDIPDWSFIESGLKRFDNKVLSDLNSYPDMFNCSPIKYVDNIRTPLLLNIGSKDLRVPPAQSYELRKALLARNANIKTFVYPDDCHSLDSAEAQCDCFVQIYQWFYDNLKK